MAFTVTTGASISGTSATATVAVPGGSAAAGDFLICHTEGQTGTGGFSLAGWTKSADASIAGLAGTSRINVMTKIADGSEGASQIFNVAATVNHWVAQMAKVTGHGLSVIGDLVVGTVAQGATGSGNITGVPSVTVTAGSLIVFCATDALDVASSTQYSAWACTDPSSLTEQMDILNTTGNGGGIGMATDVCAGTSSGTGSATRANSTDSWNAVLIGIKPAAAATTSLLWSNPPTRYIPLGGGF